MWVNCVLKSNTLLGMTPHSHSQTLVSMEFGLSHVQCICVHKYCIIIASKFKPKHLGEKMVDAMMQCRLLNFGGGGLKVQDRSRFVKTTNFSHLKYYVHTISV